VILMLITAILLRYGFNQLRTRGKHREFAAPLDREIPLEPESVWIYMSLFPFAIRCALKAPRLADLVAACRALWRIASVTAHFHVHHPSHFPRPKTVDADRDLTAAYWRWLHLLDDANGTWPSGHVAQSVYLGLTLGDEDDLVWSLLIAASTMATKQHYLLDVLGGLVLASSPADVVHDRLMHIMENYPSICAGTTQIDGAWLHPAIRQSFGALQDPPARALASIQAVLADLMHIAQGTLRTGVRTKGHATFIMIRSMVFICWREAARVRTPPHAAPSAHRPPPMALAKAAMQRAFSSPG